MYGTFGYQSSDATLPLLVGYYCVPLTDSAGLRGMVLIQMWYNSIANALASFNHVRACCTQNLACHKWHIDH